MILEKQEYIIVGQRKAIRVLMQCDTPNCKKQFFRPECRAERISPFTGRRVKQYCSRECKAPKGVMLKCENCNKDHYVHKCRLKRSTKNGRFCSHKCYMAYSKQCSVENCTGRSFAMSRSGLCRYHYNKDYDKRQRHKIYDMLGGARCVCCGEKDPIFLQIDHVDNNGSSHRKSLGTRAVKLKHYAAYLSENPGGLQVLCANCNYAKLMNKGDLYRPHKWTRRSSQGERCTS